MEPNRALSLPMREEAPEQPGRDAEKRAFFTLTIFRRSLAHTETHIAHIAHTRPGGKKTVHGKGSPETQKQRP